MLIRALLLADGYRLQYKVLRCTSQLLGSTHVFGSHAAGNLRHSRFCRQFHLADRDAKFWNEREVEQLNRLCVERRIDVILPSDSATTGFLSRYGALLARPIFPVPAGEAFLDLDDKARFAALCLRLQVPVPVTHLCSDPAEVLQILADAPREVRFIIKPVDCWGSVGVRRIDPGSDPRALLDTLTYRPLVLQEFIEGEDATTVVFARGGVVLRSVSYQLRDGVVHFFRHEESVTHSEAIVRALQCDGILVFDFRITPAGAVRFIECNPRFWYRVELTMLAGANFVAYGLADDATAEWPVVRVQPQIAGPRALMRRLFSPWRLTRTDLRVLRFFLKDPLMYLLQLGRLLSREGREADGKRF
ncbi:ATP-grasp domain-containing protein [Jiella sp. M17.18]|uniref:ATP-grasp domain-containing protein n=1 Tax=Jiella sp. M17.18 TaxID=3234247 RepID=UPI0034DE94FC